METGWPATHLEDGEKGFGWYTETMRRASRLMTMKEELGERDRALDAGP